MKPLFSVVTIMRNEGKHLPKLGDSLKEFLERGGEWISLDTGSTDNSIEVAESLGCKVYDVGDKFRIIIGKEKADVINKKFIIQGEESIIKTGDTLFDYASARNYISALASNDVCAMPDCDEIYTKLDVDKINERIEAGIEQLEYNFVFSHDEQGNPLIQFLHCKFYNRTKLKWVGIIHEILDGVAKREYLNESVIKLEHYQNVETNRNGYLTGLALDCYNNPENDRNAHYFARELMYKGRFKSAIKQFELHIAMNRWAEERSQSAVHIGDCYYHINNIDESFKWYIKSVDICAGRREALMKLAEHYFRNNSPAHVIIYAEAALAVQGTSFYSNYQPYYENLPHELLYWAYWYIGNKQKSKEHYDKAFSYQPTNKKYLSEKSLYYPTNELEFTGERVVIDKMENRPDILSEHLQRYEFAAKFTEGLVVLDAACGTGYGKTILKAKQYIGVDIDDKTLNHATENYGFGFFNENLENGIINGQPVDVVISFETIEHLENPHKFLTWIKNNAKTFIFSIPVNMPSEFHKQVYSIEQIKQLIDSYFPSVIYMAQKNEIDVLEQDAKYVVGIAYIEPLPEVCILIPTLGRESGLIKCLNSIENLIYPKHLIKSVIIKGEETVPQKIKSGVSENDSDYFCYAANDMEFEPESLLIAITKSIILNKGLVSFNEGPVLEDEGNICTHFIIKKDLINKIGGEVFDTRLNHVGVDNLLHKKCKDLNEFHYCESAKIIHNHFSKGFEMDEVYKKGWSNVEKDRKLLCELINEK